MKHERDMSSDDVPLNEPLKYPWRVETNDRYREAVALVMSLSTASLLLPVFFARDFLAIDAKTPLRAVFTCAVYSAWASFGISILAGVVFHYFSPKWIRRAWGQSSSLGRIPLSDRSIEVVLETSFWLTVSGFLGGIALTLAFFRSYPNS